MKKLFLGSAALIVFSLSIILFQISCQKDAVAQTVTTTGYTLPAATTSTLGGVIVGSGLSVNANGTLSVNSTGATVTQQNKILYIKYSTSSTANNDEIWSANYDGSNQQKVNIVKPAGFNIEPQDVPAISPDRQTIFFSMYNITTNVHGLYSANINGSNVQLIVAGTASIAPGGSVAY